ncbi:hypothetical protein C0J52_15849 [Blattella germanica]|nr:hypothetical protein C0J52_15849 [Blattella germanica]
MRQGYTLFRHSENYRATHYERQIRLDQFTLGQTQCKSKENILQQNVIIDNELKTKNTNLTHGVENSIHPEKANEEKIIQMKSVAVSNDCVKSESDIKKSAYMNSVGNEQSEAKNVNDIEEMLPSKRNVDRQVPSDFNHNNQDSNEFRKKHKEISVVESDETTHKVGSKGNEKTENRNTNDIGDINSVVGIDSVSNNKAGDFTNTKDKKSAILSEEIDIIIVDDSSSSMDGNEKGKSQNISEEKTNDACKCSKNPKKTEDIQNSSQKYTQSSAKNSDAVDLSGISQKSRLDIGVHTNVRNSSVDGRPLVKSNKEIEIVEVVLSDTTKQKNKCQSDKGGNEIECMQPKDVNMRTSFINTVQDSGSLSSKQQASLIRQNRKKITNVQLKDEEINIMPNVIDLSEDEIKPVTCSVIDTTSHNDIEIVDLEENENERKKILDSIPSIDGKYVIHVKVPERSLLPPNVCPQKEDYYIRRSHVNEMQGTRPHGTSNNRQNSFQNNHARQSDGLVNPWNSVPPWAQFPPVQTGGGAFGVPNMWNNSSASLLGLGMQALFQRASAMWQSIPQPSWLPNAFSLPYMPQQSINTYEHDPWHYVPRPFYRRPYYKRRRRYGGFGSHYNSAPRYGNPNFRNNVADTNVVHPMNTENARPEPVVQIHDDEMRDDIIECSPVKTESNSMKVENDVECISDRNQPLKNNQSELLLNSSEKSRKRKGSNNQMVCESPKKPRSVLERLITETKENKDDSTVLDTEKPTDARNWRDLKCVLQVVTLESSSEEDEDDDTDDDDDDDNSDDSDDVEEEKDEDEREENIIDDDDDDYCMITKDVHGREVGNSQPLVLPDDCRNIGSILSKLQIIKSVDFKEEKISVQNKLKVSYDLYLPSSTFRKASPGLPNYRITVIGYEEPIPEPKEVADLLKDFEDDVPLLFAIVLPDTVTFLQFGSIQLPVESFSL